jgi:DNA replication protein DnaC
MPSLQTNLKIRPDHLDRQALIYIRQSQLPPDTWHQYLQEATIADAILDRIFHRAHRIELKGQSLRKREMKA